jgi:hypothetical protein
MKYLSMLAASALIVGLTGGTIAAHADELVQVAPHRYLGHVMRYDPAAAQDAAMKVHAFLRDNIGDQPEPP